MKRTRSPSIYWSRWRDKDAKSNCWKPEMEDSEPSLAEGARQLGVTSSAIYKALQKRDSEKFQ